MRRVVVIVVRDQADLYDYFRRGFEGVEGVRVLLDRRIHVGGREGDAGVEPERRRELDVYEELQFRGFVIRPDT